MINTIKRTFSCKNLQRFASSPRLPVGISLFPCTGFVRVLLFLCMLQYAFGTRQHPVRVGMISSFLVHVVFIRKLSVLLDYTPLCLVIYSVIVFISLFFIPSLQILCIGAQGISTFCFICRENL